MIVNTSAIVLKSFSYGESSLIARCFSEKNGKVSLVIKGAKKHKKLKKKWKVTPISLDVRQGQVGPSRCRSASPYPAHRGRQQCLGACHTADGKHTAVGQMIATLA